MDPNNERDPEEIVPQPMEEGDDAGENAEGDGHMEDRGDGVHFERADDQGHGDTGSPSTAWNDPPRLAARPATALPRRNLTRRVAFLLGTGPAAAAPAGAVAAPAAGAAAAAAAGAAVAGPASAVAAQGPPAGTSAVPVGFNQNDVDLLDIITTLKSMLGTSCLVRQVNKFQEYWASSVCTADMKDTVLKMTRHIRDRQYREAELLHAILALHPSGGWFALYFRQIINLLRDGISAEPNKDLLE